MQMTRQLDILPLEQAAGRAYPAAVESYFAHYGLALNGDGREHLFGTFPSGDFKLAAHLFRPAAYRATVVLLHGYLNHSAQFKNLIPYLLDQGFAVGVFDLPGHGLSSGPEAAIDSFDQYSRALNDFVAVLAPRLHAPYYTVGFSLGGAIAMDILLKGKTPFEKTVLAAPLIHWTQYEQSKGTYKVYSAFTDRIRRFHQRNTSDKAYLLFNRTQDYLHCQSLSLRWVKALFEWNDGLASAKPCRSPVLVLQGDKDRTVDWEVNLKLVRDKFPHARIERIPGARHELFNESDIYKEQAFKSAAAYLQT